VIGVLVAAAAAGALGVAPAPAPADAPIQTIAAEEPSGGPPSPLDLLSVLDLDFHIGPWKFKGYVQADAAQYLQAPAGPLETDYRRGAVNDGDSARARELNDGALLRRARIGGEGTFGDKIAYRAMFELGANGERGNPRIAEVWIRYRPFTAYTVTAGAFPQLANMEDATSSDALLFLERATAADLARALGAGDGRIGVMFRRADAKWLAALSFNGPVIDNAANTSPRAAIVARVSRTLANSPEASVHLGGSAIYVLSPAARDQPGQGLPIRLAETPEVDVDSMPLIDTGEIAARHATVLGLEFAAQRGRAYVQAEAFRFQVERAEGAPGGSPRFYGGYIEGSWILTGERRRFDSNRGAFWFPKPARPLGQGGLGAWEIAFRYSRMSLNAMSGEPGAPPPPGGVRGGDQQILSLALEWYPRTRLRFILEASHVSIYRLNPASALDPEPFGPPPETPPLGVQIGQNLNIFAFRGRIAY
jgi:phosphate-selective porin OprO/OprP